MGSKMPGALNPSYTHGLSHTSEYKSWIHMKDRCLNPLSKRYGDYGGRGIGICPDWENDFKAFYDYVGAKTNPKMSIERIDNDGNYEPGNVKWASHAEQAKNRRVFKTSVSQHRGISKYWGKWKVIINSNKRAYYLGLYPTLEEAIKVRKEAELKYWGTK